MLGFGKRSNKIIMDEKAISEMEHELERERRILEAKLKYLQRKREIEEVSKELKVQSRKISKRNRRRKIINFLERR